MQSFTERRTQGSGIVTVFGGTGFLGRCVVRHLLDHNIVVRVATRHSQRAYQQFGNANVEPVTADVHDERSVADALSGAQGAVNAVSLYVEHGDATEARALLASARKLATVLLFSTVKSIRAVEMPASVGSAMTGVTDLRAPHRWNLRTRRSCVTAHA
jgi:uncharacterized protein YbjT (DUF2867 family)